MIPSPPIVTIDGPAGVGKSTVGRRVAIALRLPFIDTGIFYRALAVAASRSGLGRGDSQALARLAAGVNLQINVEAEAGPDAWQARVDGAELRAELWDPELASLLAYVAQEEGVRESLLHWQRVPALGGAVAVGRDTGTVVFPRARCKVYLDASAEVRVARRRQELQSRGLEASEALLEADIVTRDQTDRNRQHGPLAVPADALPIETSSRSAEEVVELVLDECRRRGVGPSPAGLPR